MVGGRLKEIIMIKHPKTTITPFGDTIVTWDDKVCTRANVIYASSNKNVEVGEVYMSYEVTFQVRVYHKIDEYDIITWNNVDWRIVGIEKQKEMQLINIRAARVNE